MRRQDVVWTATCAVLAFSAAVFGAGRGMSVAWPWFIFGALVGLTISLALRNLRL